MRTDPDGGLVRPEGLLLIDPAEEILLDGIPRAKEGKKTKTNVRVIQNHVHAPVVRSNRSPISIV